MQGMETSRMIKSSCVVFCWSRPVTRLCFVMFCTLALISKDVISGYTLSDRICLCGVKNGSRVRQIEARGGIPGIYLRGI